MILVEDETSSLGSLRKILPTEVFEDRRQRLYSMSGRYNASEMLYDVLEKTQKGNLDTAEWLLWFIECLDRAISLSEENLSGVTQKAKFWESQQSVALNDRQRNMLNKLMDGFDGMLTSSKWAKIAKCSPDTALRDCQDLIEKGFWRRKKVVEEVRVIELNHGCSTEATHFRAADCDLFTGI